MIWWRSIARRSKRRDPAVWMAFVIVMLVGASTRADDNEDLHLRDVLWQWLSDEVQSVCLGPDGRTWLFLESTGELNGIDEAKEVIAREFDKKSPPLAGIRPVLFEPAKRIWFTVGRGDILLAFDGVTWIEKALPSGHRFTGDCLGQGSIDGGGPNLIVGEHRYFPDLKGVHVFDGTT